MHKEQLAVGAAAAVMQEMAAEITH